ncbi:MAG: hypothetical protein AAGJ10_10225 [Bacteroidota bacterium]
MTTSIRWAAALVMLAVAVPVSVQAQDTGVDRTYVPSQERVDPFERRRDNIDANNIRATITNWTQTAQSGDPGDFWYEWPKNTNRRYVALTQLWVGSQVQDDNGEDIWIVNVSDFRTNPNDENISWTFEPIKGYVNPAGAESGIAQSDDPTSWPSFWPDKQGDVNDPGWSGSWNGFFGRDVFNADQEFFYKAGDDQYNRYPNYFPDETDLTRKGLGIIADTRVMAWSQILIDDVIFALHGITNDGTKDLDRVGIAVWLADCVGGDCSDDVPFFDLLEDVAWMTDQDGIGDQNFGSNPVGVAAIAFLETPGNATDRIDNDADGSTDINCDPMVGECSSPVVPESFLVGEDPLNAIDDNGNGLVDENQTHIPFSSQDVQQVGVGYADFIDNDADGEPMSPAVTLEMVGASASDRWNRWPPNPESDPVQTALDGSPIIHLVGVGEDDQGLGFKDNIDNDDSYVSPQPPYQYLTEPGSPTVTQEMVDAAATDPYGRFRVPGTDIILYAVGPEDLGKAYADGIDNDEDGAVDEGIDEGIDEMIDESRSDGIDNDGDWNPLRDDVGLDGVAFNGDPGDGDMSPTTGAGTDLPGERNIDKTDVSESDQIGITNVQNFGSGALNISNVSDRRLFFDFLLPGEFDTEQPEPGDNDLTVSSGLFPLAAGQTERISLSVQLGLTQEEALQGRDFALQAYQEDYQFAQAPVTPTLRAVAGDGRVTLYWDSDSEESEDAFLQGLGLPFRDFEGYRIYRSTDPAFLDPLEITDGRGNLTFRTPLRSAEGKSAIFDLINENEGFHPVDVNGIKYFMGNNVRDADLGEDETGLTHTFIDSTVTNGLTYYYALTAFDFGAPTGNIPPTETPIRIQRAPDGTITTGPNVVEITPTQAVAGYEGADLVDLARVAGSTSSRIGYEIIDPTVLEEGTRYRIVFEDTLLLGDRNTPDTLTTKNFSLIDVTNNRTLIDRSTTFGEDSESPVLSDDDDPLGFQLFFMLEPFVVLNKPASLWNDDPGDAGIYPITLDPYLSAGFVKGLRNPNDYRIRVVGDGQGMSSEMQVTRRTTLPARPTNVEVFQVAPDGTETPVEYGFWDLTGPDFVSPTATTPASLSADPSIGESDLIIIRERQVGQPDSDPVITWRIGLNFVFSDRASPTQGDAIDVITRKPFLSTDVFEFTTRASAVDAERAANELENINVVPNPYVATNQFEGLNPFSTGRGPRVIKFINLPAQCTLRIFTVSGKLVRTLQRDMGSNDATSLLDGTLEWNLESEDGLGVSYGVYLYHVDAPGIGEHTGTFAIIK